MMKIEDSVMIEAKEFVIVTDMMTEEEMNGEEEVVQG